MDIFSIWVLIPWIGGQWLLAWLAHKHVPPAMGRLALVALLLIAVAAFAAFIAAGEYFGDAVRAGTLEASKAIQPLSVLLLTVLGAIYLTVAFAPSLFGAHRVYWTAATMLIVLIADLGLLVYMGLSLCWFSNSCP